MTTHRLLPSCAAYDHYFRNGACIDCGLLEAPPMTTPSSEAARAEAERRYRVTVEDVDGNVRELRDWNRSYKDAFMAGAEWKGAQEPTWLPSVIASMRATSEAHLSALDEIIRLEAIIREAMGIIERSDGLYHPAFDVLAAGARTLQEGGRDSG